MFEAILEELLPFLNRLNSRKGHKTVQMGDMVFGMGVTTL